ncbi:MAG: biotin transporter BioY [Gemmatimonadaceae bacterium]
MANSRAITLVGVVGFALALAAASQVALPLPFTPVPITMQPLLVVLAGLWLGSWAGATSMLLYLVAGALGLPVFAPMGAPGFARLLGPTGGYLLAYPAAAWVAGRVGHGAGTYLRRVLAAAAGILVLHVGGATQLTILTGDLSRAIAIGVLPFLALDVLKAFAAGLLSATPRSAKKESA